MLPFFSNLFTVLQNLTTPNHCELDPCVCDIFDSASVLEFIPKVLTLTPWTPSTYLPVKPAISA